jgi:hypothetical protein
MYHLSILSGNKSRLVIVLFLSLLVSVVSSQTKETKLIVKTMLGLGGKADLDDAVAGVPGDFDSDMETTIGVGAQIERSFHPRFCLGGFTAFHSWNTDEGEEANRDRNVIWDISLLFKPKYDLQLSGGGEIELFLAIPIGLSFNFIDDDWNENIETGVGTNLAFLFGTLFYFNESVGMAAELGPSFHHFSYDYNTPGTDPDPDFQISIIQTNLNIGVVFRL